MEFDDKHRAVGDQAAHGPDVGRKEIRSEQLSLPETRSARKALQRTRIACATVPRNSDARWSAVLMVPGRASWGAPRPTTGKAIIRFSGREPFSGGASFVVMMQTAEMRDLNDSTGRRRLHRPGHGRILVQREVRPPIEVVGEVLLKMTPQGAFVPHDDVVQALGRLEPITRSTNGFCQGDRGAVSTSSMPIASAPRRNSAP